MAVACNGSENLSNYVDQQGSAELRRAIEGHIAWCRRCHVVFDTTGKELKIVLDAEPFEVPLAVNARLYSQAERRKCRVTSGPLPTLLTCQFALLPHEMLPSFSNYAHCCRPSRRGRSTIFVLHRRTHLEYSSLRSNTDLGRKDLNLNKHVTHRRT